MIVLKNDNNFQDKLQDVASKLGPILNIGETFKPKQKEQKEENINNNSGEKYSNITKPIEEYEKNYKRETSIASVSNVEFNGSRSETPMTESRISTAKSMRKNFESS